MIERIFRVVRGGSWVDNPDTLHAAYRYYHRPMDRYNYVGFRLVVRIKDE